MWYDGEIIVMIVYVRGHDRNIIIAKGVTLGCPESTKTVIARIGCITCGLIILIVFF